MTCRFTKWKVERPSRSATGGPAGHQEDEPSHHQRGERRQQRAIDRPPPVADQASVPRATP